MSQKKRVNDLAKEIGMSGADLVKKLREWGFEFKSPQSAIEDYQDLQIRGQLEARGLLKIQEQASEDGAEKSGGLVLKRKKKKKADEGEGEAPPQPVADAAPVEEPQAAPEVHEPEAPAPRPARAPEVVQRPTPPIVEVVEHQSAPARAPEEPVRASTSDTEVAPAPARSVPPAAAPVAAPSAPAAPLAPAAESIETPVAPQPAPTPAPASAPARPAAPIAASAAAAAPTPAAPAAPAAPDAPAKSATPPMRGKVVGFIDLSKIASQQPKKVGPESRRLRSRDDVAPDVRPTLSGPARTGVVRGSGAGRSQLSSAQLRDRESSRFLKRGGPRSGPQGGGGPHRPGRIGATSPLGGQTLAIDAPVTVRKLADKLAVKANEVIMVAVRKLGMDLMKVNLNSVLDEDTAVLLGAEFQVELKVTQEIAAEQTLIAGIQKKRTDIDSEHLTKRPPTVAFLGHVDHGKTTLIDTIRASRVAEGEAGGITQHIGAYQVETKSGHKLTIIDTPGHASFTAMRARGAKAVDIVVLVVASDDGVMPSTEEALNHARAAKAPVVVALTKVDKAEANIKRAQESLSRLGLIPEEWGGETAMIPVSALKKQGIDELLERVFLESEVLELQSHPKGPAQGVVLEAEINEGRGIVAHLLVQDGTLNRGDVILAGEGYGKVRSIQDDRGKVVQGAPPSMPVEVTGLTELPGVGERFYVVESLDQAKEVAEERARKNRAMSLLERRQVTAESLMSAVADAKRLAINLVVRADVQGSVEVLKSALSELKHEEVEVKVIQALVGAVTENDVLLASTTNSIVIAFHVGVNDKARATADRLGVEIRYHEIIYELLDQMREQMEGVLAPQMNEEVTGHVEVRALFKSSKVGTIAGCHVLDGSIVRDSKIRLLRDGRVIHTGQISSLRREKDDAKEVRAGFDCGITVKDYQDVRERDVLEAFKMVTVKRKLGDKAGV